MQISNFGLFLALAVPTDHKKTDYKEDGALVDIKLPAKHVLSRELQVCLIHISFLYQLF